jgi:DNA-binding transcriptional LysR family regulator
MKKPSPTRSTAIRPPTVKVNYLELFHHVAEHQGISSGLEHMPYAIHQPALSEQLKLLEDFVGTPLFRRRPFELTPAGEIIRAYVKPFFDGLPAMIEEARGAQANVLRVAASRAVLRGHLRPVLKSIDQEFPDSEFTLWEGLKSQIDPWFDAKRIDVAVTVLEGKLPAGCAAQSLLRLPLILVVPADSSIQSAEELLRPGERRPRLLGPMPEDAISQRFQAVLAQRSLRWRYTHRVSSLELIETYVGDGLGVGLSVAVPGKELPAGLRALRLPGFPLLNIGVIWRRNAGPAVQALVRHVQELAVALRKG